MNRHTHRPRKRFGQNFLHDRGIIERILAAARLTPEDHVVEIGPGLGALTLPLRQRVGRLELVELDRDLVAHWQQRLGDDPKVRIHAADALDFDFAALKAERPLRLIGNLPYNISTPLIFHLLSQRQAIADMLFMLQREVVDRLGAAPGSKAYGRLSVMVQSVCRVDPLFRVPPGAFRPAPKVESRLVRLTPYLQPPHPLGDEALFARLVAAAFGQRRKTLRNTLKGMVTEADLRACGIDPSARAEKLTIADYAALSRRLSR